MLLTQGFFPKQEIIGVFESTTEGFAPNLCPCMRGERENERRGEAGRKGNEPKASVLLKHNDST